MDRKNLFLILLVLGTAFWGISFPVVKLAIGHFSSSTFLFYRFLTASLVLSLIFAGQFKKTDWNSVKIGISLAIPLTFGIYNDCAHVYYLYLDYSFPIRNRQQR
jgi:drug/metabolite transporter (DMT)-like permease